MTVPQEALAGLACAALLSLAAPLAVYLICRRRMVLSWRNIGLGAATFFLFALVLESALHWYVLKHNPVTSVWLRTHGWGFAAYGAAMAALFEETGRYLALRLLAKRTGDPGTAVAYGLGHGGLEAILVGFLAQVLALVMAVMLNLGMLGPLLARKLPPAAIAKLEGTLVHLNFGGVLVGGFERVWALLLQIALSLLVWRAVSRRELRWLLAALALHAGIDSLAGATGVKMISIAATETALTVVGLFLLLLFLLKLPRKNPVAG